MPKSLNARSILLFFITCLVLLNLTVLLNIPVLRQFSGFIFLTFIPGFLILVILKLTKLGLVEKIVLSVGLSVAFVMLFGLLVNFLSLAIGYTKPLSTFPLLVSFSIATLVLAIIAYKRNKDITFSFSGLWLTTREKALLIVPTLFPLLSIVGMRIMNLTDNNILLMLLLFLIPMYIVFVAFFRNKVSEGFYPVCVYLIGLSLLLMLPLRSRHIIGSDVHDMYYLFQLTFREGHWGLFINGLLDATLSISLLPAIYQTYLKLNPLYLFNILYSLLFSISPLVVFVIAKKYLGSFHALIASFFFMAQVTFLWASNISNSILAILFFALAIMVRFYEGMSEFARRFLFVVFAISAIVSHYSTSYIFFFVLLGTWLGVKIVRAVLPHLRKTINQSDHRTAGSNYKAVSPDRISSDNDNGTAVANVVDSKEESLEGISGVVVLLFFVALFTWYSTITVTPFQFGVAFIRETFLRLNESFLLESKGSTIAAAVGEGISTAPQQIRVAFSWLSVALTGIGVLGTMVKYRQMLNVSDSLDNKPEFLRVKFQVGEFVLVMICSAILVLTVVLPFVSRGYDMERTYGQMLTVLSPFLIIGSVMMGKLIRTPPHWIALLVVLPFFLSTTGVLYQLLGYQASLMLNSAGREYAVLYVSDEESYEAQWLATYRQEDVKIYPVGYTGLHVLTSEGNIPAYSLLTKVLFSAEYQKSGRIDGYIYLRPTDTTVYKLVQKYSELFAVKSKIYTAGASEVYR